ncbi:hypothetical protein MG293_001822 [Ovis ammon polii]|uniref:Uncharacterized protein n=1 Tax=Ovis ammon polii TaxID=230172 RepID=A0AAD4YJ37_OVIAM|nr:hypothetical protein MG293_001822 [Ovis ammon polii]
MESEIVGASSMAYLVEFLLILIGSSSLNSESHQIDGASSTITNPVLYHSQRPNLKFFEWFTSGEEKEKANNNNRKTNQKPKTQIQPGNGEVKDKRREANHGAFTVTPALHPFSLGLTRPSLEL